MLPLDQVAPLIRDKEPVAFCPACVDTPTGRRDNAGSGSRIRAGEGVLLQEPHRLSYEVRSATVAVAM
jgi:hypothetical protein